MRPSKTFDAALQDTIAPKGTPADDELPKAVSLARMLSYASRTSSGGSPFASSDMDAVEKGGSVITRLRRRIRRPTRSSLQVPYLCCPFDRTKEQQDFLRTCRKSKAFQTGRQWQHDANL